MSVEVGVAGGWLLRVEGLEGGEDRIGGLVGVDDTARPAIGDNGEADGGTGLELAELDGVVILHAPRVGREKLGNMILVVSSLKALGLLPGSKVK